MHAVKFSKMEKKEKYTICKLLLHKRKAPSLRQCNSIAPIQIMHSTVNEKGVLVVPSTPS